MNSNAVQHLWESGQIYLNWCRSTSSVRADCCKECLHVVRPSTPCTAAIELQCCQKCLAFPVTAVWVVLSLRLYGGVTFTTAGTSNTAHICLIHQHVSSQLGILHCELFHSGLFHTAGHCTKARGAESHASRRQQGPLYACFQACDETRCGEHSRHTGCKATLTSARRSALGLLLFPGLIIALFSGPLLVIPAHLQSR